MQLLILGELDGHLTTASQIALSRGAKVHHAPSVERGMALLRSGQGADLVIVDTKLAIARLIENLKSERINVPVVASGIVTVTARQLRAITASDKE